MKDNRFVLNFLFSEHVVREFPVALIASPYLDSYDDRSLIEYFFPYLESTVSPFLCELSYRSERCRSREFQEMKKIKT